MDQQNKTSVGNIGDLT